MTESQPKRALALVGMPGAGKSVCARYLEKRGFFQFRFGSIVVNEVLKRGLPLAPEYERAVREEFRAQDGMAAIAKRALPVLQAALDERDHIIIDGLYSWSEYKLLQRELGAQLIVVAVICPRSLRYSRLAKRKERPLTTAEAEQRDYAEIERLEKGGPIAMADYMLLNDGKKKTLLKQMKRLIKELDFDE